MNDLRNGLHGTALVLAAAALGGCGQVANVPGRDCLDWNMPGAGVMVSAKPGFPDHNGKNPGIPGPIYSLAGGARQRWWCQLISRLRSIT